ncbi:hypothetical protein L195_g047219 [Trifolium pratense]|uniref:Uncharacterized protein n=1 Tax=Trifolium pratense TaxID=57577 RepID=A0A2K3MJY7_TRIPR|nr:hypothetical protein L195_g047219 [Trifolium pratense]
MPLGFKCLCPNNLISIVRRITTNRDRGISATTSGGACSLEGDCGGDGEGDGVAIRVILRLLDPVALDFDVPTSSPLFFDDFLNRLFMVNGYKFV